MASWLDPWLYMDPLLPKKYMLLRQMIARVREQGGKVLFYINHGPGPVAPEDMVRRHLGTSVFDDGSFDDKILDLVLSFRAEEEPLAELRQWRRFDPTDTTGGASARIRRRNVLVQIAVVVVAILSLPVLLFSCQQNQQANGGGGFGGGML